LKKSLLKNETTQETTQEKIIYLIRNNPYITRKSIAVILGLSEDGVKYHLNKLTKKGIIKHKESTKSGYWEILL